MKRVLVTGATGFIGRGALAPLLAADHEVHAVSTRPAPRWSPPGVVWHRADLLRGGSEELLRSVRPARLLHFAWDAEPGSFWTSEANLRWVEASLRLLSAFANVGGERVVMAGTCAEYEWRDETHCLENGTPTIPKTLYGSAKNGLRNIADAHSRQRSYELAWGRIFFVFGPFEDERRLGGSVASALAAGQVARTSHGEQVRDFLYAPELAEAFVAILCSEVTGSVNVASGRPVLVKDFVRALAEAVGRPDLVELGARLVAADEPRVLTADVSRLRDEVGWQPTRTLAEAASDAMAWWTHR